MANISKALSARANKILDTRTRYGCGLGIMTRRQFCETMAAQGAKHEIKQVQAIAYSRRKLNNMDLRESMAYEKAMERKKDERRIFYPGQDGTYLAVTKTEYDYFLSLLA